MNSGQFGGDSHGDAGAWRGVVAALVNDELRAEYARIVLQREPFDERRTSRLVRSGLVELDNGRPVPARAALRAMLADRSGERPRRGPERFLRDDGSVDRYPSQHAGRTELLRHIADQVMAADERISEQELNDRLRRFDQDTALLRRYLVDYGIVARTRSGSEYSYPTREGEGYR